MSLKIEGRHSETSGSFTHNLPRSVSSPRTMAAFVLMEKGLATVSPILSKPIDYALAHSAVRAAATTGWQASYESQAIFNMVERMYKTADFETLEVVYEPKREEEYKFIRRLNGRHVWNKVEGKQLKARYLWNKRDDLWDYYHRQEYHLIEPKDKSDLAKAKRAEEQLMRKQIASLDGRLKEMSVYPMTDEELFKIVMTKLVENSLPRN